MQATELDGSCIYEGFYDYDGNCLNDTDGDGVCDELDIRMHRQHRVQLRSPSNRTR